MRLWAAQQRDILFDLFERDAFHLELRDAYYVDSEDESYRRWQHGETPDPSDYDRPWLRRIRAVVESGRTVRRVRVIAEPLSEYIRYEHCGTPQNLAAGEDIRWLPRHLVPADIVFPLKAGDWWLFDDCLIAIGHFDERGISLGSEVRTDPLLVGQCVYVRDRVWELAIPHDRYSPG